MEPAQARAPTLQGHLVAWEGVGERGGGWDSEICLSQPCRDKRQKTQGVARAGPRLSRWNDRKTAEAVECDPHTPLSHLFGGSGWVRPFTGFLIRDFI